VAGEAEDGETAVTLALQDAPSIVLMNKRDTANTLLPAIRGLTEGDN
jgi:hypothetical protein